jgi:hypothetical protein
MSGPGIGVLNPGPGILGLRLTFMRGQMSNQRLSLCLKSRHAAEGRQAEKAVRTSAEPQSSFQKGSIKQSECTLMLPICFSLAHASCRLEELSLTNTRTIATAPIYTSLPSHTLAVFSGRPCQVKLKGAATAISGLKRHH